MARPRSFDDDEVAEGLLGAFWLRGYPRTSISDLATATGLLPGSLYGAFGSKEDMFRIALDRYVAQLRGAVVTGVPGLEGLRHAFDTVVRLTARDPERRGCLLINAIPESGALSEDTRRALQRGLHEMRRHLRDRLREAAGDATAPADLEPLAALLFGAMVSIRVLGRAGFERRALQDVADGAIAAVRRWLDTP